MLEYASSPLIIIIAFQEYQRHRCLCTDDDYGYNIKPSRGRCSAITRAANSG
ncbi:MAG: hypothetical protein M9916_01715 [Crocinitomicaceae bacterium]|nr:hypothetical protein [Crocinitomicaceae bacterium]